MIHVKGYRNQFYNLIRSIQICETICIIPTKINELYEGIVSVKNIPKYGETFTEMGIKYVSNHFEYRC